VTTQYYTAATLDGYIADDAPASGKACTGTVTLGGGAPLLPRRLSAQQLELEVAQDGRFVRLRYRVRKAA
jgi:hypothetical protein